MANQTLSVTEARNTFLKLVDSSDEVGAKYTITKRGEPAAVLLGVNEFEEMIETIEILGDKNLMMQILAFEQSDGEMKTHSVDELMGEIMNELD